MEVISSLLLASVWAGHPVGFDFITHGDKQFVAFYDADRNITVASRTLGEDTWAIAHPEGVWRENRKRLSSTVGWDSHNSLVMAIDDSEDIHLCGNMHVDPLIYFRTTRPLDVTSFERVDRMVGKNEDRCTYPVFMRGPNDELIFRYRDGRSGNGVDFYNTYDAKTRTWHRLVDKPLLDGLDRMNAYARMPQKGPDGWFHMVWMWRDTPDCATNHDLSYARSKDLIHWETGEGKALELPITIESSAVVDPVPPGGGIINMTQSLGFDRQNRPVISYHKNDAQGYTQAYCARLENGRWKIYQISHWTYHWAFSGGGSIGAEIRLSGVHPEPDGGLSLHYWHIKEGKGIWKLDPETLAVVGAYPPPKNELPADLERVTSTYPGMTVRTLWSRGHGPDSHIRYLLRWETLSPHRDRPRDEAPPPSELRVYTIKVK